MLSHKNSQQGWARSGRVREAKSREDFGNMFQREGINSGGAMEMMAHKVNEILPKKG